MPPATQANKVHRACISDPLPSQQCAAHCTAGCPGCSGCCPGCSGCCVQSLALPTHSSAACVRMVPTASTKRCLCAPPTRARSPALATLPRVSVSRATTRRRTTCAGRASRGGSAPATRVCGRVRATARRMSLPLTCRIVFAVRATLACSARQFRNAPHAPLAVRRLATGVLRVCCVRQAHFRPPQQQQLATNAPRIPAPLASREHVTGAQLPRHV